MIKSDAYLIEHYLLGDTSMLPLLVKRWHKIFCEKAYWVVKDKDLAKDVAQECWIIIIRKLPTLQNVDSFKSWALRIVYSKSIDAYNQRMSTQKKRQEVHRKSMDDEGSNKEGRIALQQQMLKAIEHLSYKQQDIIRLFYLEEYSLKEVSDFLNIPMGTAKSRLFKARETLKSIVKSSDYEK